MANPSSSVGSSLWCPWLRLWIRLFIAHMISKKHIVPAWATKIYRQLIIEAGVKEMSAPCGLPTGLRSIKMSGLLWEKERRGILVEERIFKKMPCGIVKWQVGKLIINGLWIHLRRYFKRLMMKWTCFIKPGMSGSGHRTSSVSKMIWLVKGYKAARFLETEAHQWPDDKREHW